MFFWNVIIKLICNWFCLADELQRASLGPRAPSILTVSKARDRGSATTAPAPARSSCSNGNFLREDRIIFFLFLGIFISCYFFYTLESRTLLALSRRRGLRGRGLMPVAVGRPVAGAAPPPAGILGLSPAGHSGGGGGRSGPAAVPTSPQHAAARSLCRLRRRRRAGPELVRSRVGRRCRAPFLVLLLRGSRLLRLPRHRGSSVPHPCVPGGGGGGARGAAPPAPLGSRSVRLPHSGAPLSPRPSARSEGAPPPAPCHSSSRPPAARTRAPVQTRSEPIGEEDRPPGPAPRVLTRSSALGALPHPFLQPIRKRL